MRNKFTLLFTLVSVFVFAAGVKSPLDLGKEQMRNKNYALAVPHFVNALKQLPGSEKGQQYMYITEQLAIANLKLKNYSKSAFYFDQVLQSEFKSSQATLEYAKLLVTLKQYDKASDVFTEWGVLSDNTEIADEYKAFLSSDRATRKIDFEKTLWSTDAYNEFGPTLLRSGDIMYASDQPRSKNSKNNMSGIYPSDLYVVRESGSNNLSHESIPVFAKPSGFNRGVGCLSSDGKTMYFTANTESNIPAFSSKTPQFKLGIFASQFDGYRWSKPESINFSNGQSNYAFPTLSATGDTMIFSSDQLGGQGRMDLYYSVLLNGEWSKPINMGNAVNTSGDDIYPNIVHQKGKSMLFYSTDGRPGYGGLDVFCVNRYFSDSTSISILPEPINSSYDDFGYITTSQKTIGFIASNRDGSDDVFTFTTSAHISPKAVSEVIVAVVPKDTQSIVQKKPAIKPDTLIVETKDVAEKQPIEHKEVQDKKEKKQVIEEPIDEGYISRKEIVTPDQTSEIKDVNTLYGYYMVVYSVKNFDGFMDFRDANYPDAVVVRNNNGFYHLAYYLGETKADAVSSFNNRESRFSKSWMTRFGRY